MLFTIIFFLLLISCTEEDLENEKSGRLISYTIPEGNHNAIPIFYEKVRGNKSFEVKINFLQPEYEFPEEMSDDQKDWNKAVGFSDCAYFDAYRGKGAMLGWRWNIETKKIEVSAYVHNNADKSRRVVRFFNSLEKNKEYFLSISIRENEEIYTYKIESSDKDDPNFFSEIIEMSGDNGRGCNLSYFSGRLITPYFGGNQKAPNRININIEYLKTDD